MDVERTPLPGIGTQHVLATAKGRRVGVVAHRGGRRDLVIYRRADPDSASELVILTGEEAETLAELLGTARIIERLANLHREVEGLATTPIGVAAGSPYDGRSLADTRTGTRTGASVVAVIRSGEVIPSPRPNFVFRAGDIVMVVGDEEGTTAARVIFTDG